MCISRTRMRLPGYSKSMETHMSVYIVQARGRQHACVLVKEFYLVLRPNCVLSKQKYLHMWVDVCLCVCVRVCVIMHMYFILISFFISFQLAITNEGAFCITITSDKAMKPTSFSPLLPLPRIILMAHTRTHTGTHTQADLPDARSNQPNFVRATKYVKMFINEM